MKRSDSIYIMSYLKNLLSLSFRGAERRGISFFTSKRRTRFSASLRMTIDKCRFAVSRTAGNIFRFFFMVFLLISAGTQTNAQVTAETSKAGNFNQGIYGLGFSGGAASGVGVSLRYHTVDRSSFQIVGGVFRPKSSDTFVSIGVEFQRDLVRGNTNRYYFAAASSYIYNGDSTNIIEAPFRAGAGLGGEFLVQEGVHFSFQALFTYFSDGTILPLPQLSFHYYFY